MIFADLTFLTYSFAVCVDFSAMTVTQFHHFLVVKIYDRMQEISREKCSGCQLKHRFDVLHPCITTTLEKRIYKFFSYAVVEALEHLMLLLSEYQVSHMLFEEPSFYLNSGQAFIEALRPDQLVDRRYINEDADLIFPFDSSWVRPIQLEIPTPDQSVEVMPDEDKPVKPKRQRISKKGKSIHKVPCDDPSCCKDQIL